MWTIRTRNYALYQLNDKYWRTNQTHLDERVHIAFICKTRNLPLPKMYLFAKCKTQFSDMGVKLWNELLASLRPTNQEIFWTKLHDISFGILADKDNYFDSQTSIIEVTNCKQ